MISDASDRGDGAAALRYEPAVEEIMPEGATYDLCDDEEARAAGLDPGALESDRSNLQIDCDEAGGLRYGHVVDGLLRLSESTVPPVVAADDPGPDDGVKAAIATQTGFPLGYWGREFPQATPASEVVILPDTVLVAGGVARGLVRNLSNDAALEVTISAPAGDEYRIPLTMQAGEVAAFEVELASTETVSDQLLVNAVFSDQLPMDRAILVTGSPGRWTGSPDTAPAMVTLDELGVEKDAETITLFSTRIELQSPSNHDVEALPIEEPIWIVAFYDAEGRVVDVSRGAPLFVGPNNELAQMERLELTGSQRWGSVEFGIPADAGGGFSLWLGGASG